VISELIGHYRVVASLGSGGMGVVWKAIDTRLNRPVALKAIRDADAANTDAILRLRAEALAAASLDHPYICKIYELLETGSATLVVMEFVEGENLGDILTRRTPTLVDTLRYGSEIAEGLANAHTRGIVHRDVKPTNVMVTPHNHIKLLDFGIARITADAALTQSGLTLPGNTPGTPQYMAPEQALGRHIDGRADLFSLGVLLFRCLAGQLPFEGATRDEYVQQMLTGRTRPLDQLAPAAPPPVREIVKACLERDPARRPESATIVAETLRRAADALSTGTIPVAHGPSPAIPTWLMQAAVLAIAVVAVAFGIRRWAAPADDGPRALVPAVTWPSTESDGLISPDGKWLSFISDKQNEPHVFVQAIEGGDAVAVAVPGAAVSHAWSPDGRELAAIVRQGSRHFLMVVPAFFGGSPRVSVPLDAALEQPILVRWLDDSVYIDVSRGQAGRSLLRAALPSGTVEDLSARWPKPVGYRTIDISPVTRTLVMDALVDGRPDVWTSNADGSNLRAVTKDAFVERYPLWIGRDLVVFESNRGGQMDLWQLSTASHRATQLTSSLMTEVPTSGAADGTIAFEQNATTVNLWRLTLASGSLRQLTGDALSDYWPSSGLDGRRVAFQRARPTPEEGFQFIDARILAADATGSGALEPQTIADGFGARLSSDGAWVAYYQRLPERTRLRLLVKNHSTGEVRTLSDDCILPTFTPMPPIDWIEQTMTWGNGTDLYFLTQAEKTHEISRADVVQRGKAAVLMSAPPGASLRDVRVSPDGSRLAFLVRFRNKPGEPAEKGAVDVRVRNLRDNGNSIISREPGREIFLPGWTSRNSLVLQRAKGPVGGVWELAFTELTLDGTRRPIATVDGSFASTVRLDQDRDRLYVTRTIGGIHNVHLLNLADGKMRQLTANEAPGVTFSGVQPLGSDAILFARDERRRDIWLVKRN
jgi:hypothetical protein